MPILSTAEQDALATLQAPRPITYEEFESVMQTFGFSSAFEAPETWWWSHPEHPNCGRFRECDRWNYGVLSEGQRYHAQRMIDCVVMYR